MFSEFVPEVKGTSFLGPDPKTLTFPVDDSAEGKGSKNTFAIIFSILSVSLILKLVTWKLL